jgi:hypothetical protein
MVPFVIKGFKILPNRGMKEEEEMAHSLANKIRQAGSVEQVDCNFNRIYLTSRTSFFSFFENKRLPEIGYLNNCMLEVKKSGPAFIVEYRISFIPLFTLLLLLIPFGLIALESSNPAHPNLLDLPFLLLSVYVGFNFIWLSIRYYIFLKFL